MNLATTASLTALIRARMNLTSVNTVTDAEIQLFLNESLATMYEMLVSRWRDYYVSRFSISLASNKEAYALPEDFRAVTAVLLTFGTAPTQVRQALRPFNWNEFSASSPDMIASPSYPIMYRVMENDIYFTPVPSQAYPNAVELWYVPQFKPPASTTVPISRVWPNGWERWVVLDTCVSLAARLRQAEYYAMFSKERDAMEAKVIAAAAIRSEDPLMMTDVYDTPSAVWGTPGTP